MRQLYVLAGLALTLAGLTWQEISVWESERTLWTQAQRIAPAHPRPLLGLAWVDLDAGRDADAEIKLSRAWLRTAWQPALDRIWAQDAIDATRAVIALRHGQLQAAADLMAAGPPLSERAALCHHFAGVCRLAFSPP